ncbi:MAG: Rid family hydrolase [Gammaproteobacteria bacterium]|nr:Rid family hydrolase [Gammaproteobacteria bacterium]MDO9317756.1 Rid family hydrolase [Gammaproteobacteria bacterium]
MKSVIIRPLFLSVLLFLVACGADEAGTGSVVMAQEEPVVEAAAASIERFNEGTNFYSVIAIPPGAETLYLSGAGASPKEDGSWGTMEEQAIQIFETFQATLEGMGWSLEDIVQVRVFAVASPDGSLDFEGFNTGYRRFFGSDINPMKPVRSFVQVAALVREGWLLEVEIRAARMPQ